MARGVSAIGANQPRIQEGTGMARITTAQQPHLFAPSSDTVFGIPCVPPSRAWTAFFSPSCSGGEREIEKGESSGWRRGGGGRNDAVVYRAGSLCKRAKELVSEAAGGGCLCSGACSFDQARVCKTQSPRANSKSGEKAVSERSRIHKRSKVYRVFCSANAEASSKEAKSG